MKKLVLILFAAVVATALPAVAGDGPAHEVLVLYGGMHQAMAGDTVDGVRDAAREIHDLATAEAAGATDAAPWQMLATAAETVDAEELGALREQFKGFSKAVALFVDSVGAAGAQVYFCPMADGYWLQAEGDDSPRNPYYGSSMLKCGSKVDEVES